MNFIKTLTGTILPLNRIERLVMQNRGGPFLVFTFDAPETPAGECLAEVAENLLTDPPVIIPAVPGCFIAVWEYDNPTSFHFNEPVIAWRIEEGQFVKPLTPAGPVQFEERDFAIVHVTAEGKCFMLADQVYTETDFVAFLQRKAAGQHE